MHHLIVSACSDLESIIPFPVCNEISSSLTLLILPSDDYLLQVLVLLLYLEELLAV